MKNIRSFRKRQIVVILQAKTKQTYQTSMCTTPCRSSSRPNTAQNTPYSLGTGTIAEGWINDALRFREKQMGK